MRIFKFGGASVKDANGIKNVLTVMEKVGHENVLVIISAMGKTTNAFEEVIKNYFDKSPALQSSIQEVKKYHNQILLDLFEDENSIFTKLVKLKTEQNLSLDAELNQISSLFDEVKNRAEAIQPTLQKTVEGEKVKILKRLKSIEKKFLREEKRHYSVLENKLTKLLAIVYPNGVLQERKANFLPYFLEYKNLILNELLGEFDPTKAEFKFVVTEN